ncbi:MAG: pyridoxamine 5'-phosphate oxidase family protein [Sulfitobacter sp.]
MSEDESVFHAGERILHERLGIGDRLHQLGMRMIRDHMPEQHQEFFGMLSSVHIGAVDGEGHPWAMMRVGPAGFMTSTGNRRLNIASEPLLGEPSDLQLEVGAKISIVGIEFETQRRNRLNATVIAADATGISVHVDQSYGNCPKYIQIRRKIGQSPTTGAAVTQTSQLSQQDKTQIAKADTLLIASRVAQLGDDPRAGIDINHRGGMPGFVSILDDTTLQFPDYKGNSFYNTFGNIMTDPRVGLQFVDFETGSLLNIKGTATVVEDLNDGMLPLMGHGLRIKVASITRAQGALPMKYVFEAYSDRNPVVEG